MRTLSRRHALKLSLTAGTAGLAAALPLGRAMAAAPLRVTHFGGPYAVLEEIIGGAYTAAGFGDVEFEQDQPSLILAKWQAQRNDPPYDIGLLERPHTIRAGASGLALPLTTAELPNLANALPGAVAAQGAGTALAFDTIDIMYDKTAVTTPITSWLDLWRPDLAGKIMLPGMPIDGAIVYMLVACARASGLAETEVDKIFPKFVELKQNVRSFYSDPNQATQLLERGEIVAAVQYSARIGQLMKRDQRFTRATPKEGVPAIPYDLVGASGSKNPDGIRKYINLAASPEIQQKVCSSILLNPSMKGVSLPDDVRALIISDDSKLFAVDDIAVVERQQAWIERWQREVQS